MDYPLLKSIDFQREFIHTWQFIEIKRHKREQRLYYKVGDSESHPGFDFYSVMWAGCSGDHSDDIWNLGSCEVECGVHGHAHWDCVRHLYFGDEKTGNYGYHYYSDLEDTIELMKVLKSLEDKYCAGQ